MASALASASAMSLRKAGPNENRCITRHHLGLYSNLVVGTIYSISPRNQKGEKQEEKKEKEKENHLDELEIYAPALRTCIEKYPFLSLTIQDAGSTNPVWTRPASLDLRNHFHTLHVNDLNHLSNPTSHYSSGSGREEVLLDESALLARAIEYVQNEPAYRFVNVDVYPAWALIALRLPDKEGDNSINNDDDEKKEKKEKMKKKSDGGRHRVLLLFSYSHSHGDGMSGLALLQTLYESFQTSINSYFTTNMKDEQQQQKELFVVDAPPLPVPEDISSNMPVSLAYLLLPVLGAYLPRFLARLLRLSGNLTGFDEHTWLGSTMFIDDTDMPGRKACTNAAVVHLSAAKLARLLSICKQNGTTLTPLLNHLLSLAMSAALSAAGNSTRDSSSSNRTNFVAQVPINMRKAAGVSSLSMGNYVSSASLRSEIIDPAADDKSLEKISEEMWATLRSQRETLSQCSSTLHNQPVGLLRYVSNMALWLQGKIGQTRDASWEVSNLGSFKPTAAATSTLDDDTSILDDANVANTTVIAIEQTVFAQPASPISAPISFNVVGLKDGPLTIGITWQIGALGLSPRKGSDSPDQYERQFIKHVTTIFLEKVCCLVQE